MLCQKEGERIVKLRKDGVSISQIASRFHRSRTTVRAIIAAGNVRKHKAKGVVTSSRSKRIKLIVALAKQTVRKGDRVFRKYPSTRILASALKRFHGIVVTAMTISRDLKEAGARARVRPKVPTRSKLDAQVRLSFAQKWQSWPRRKWAFSDECWITTNESTSRWQWCFDGEQALPLERKSKWNIPALMIWLCFGYGWKGKMIIFPAQMTVDGENKVFRLNSEGYVRRCLGHVSGELTSRGLKLVQDGARAHASKYVQAYAAKRGLDLTFDWPKYSPDLNMAEFMNAEVKRRLGEKCPLTLTELRQYAMEVWNEIPITVINKYSLKFFSKLEECIKRNGVA